MKHNRYELLPNLSCSNVSSCLIGAISPRIHWGFFPDWRHPSFLKQDTYKEIVKTMEYSFMCTNTSPGVRKSAALGMNLLCPKKCPVGCVTFLLFIQSFGWMKCWWNFEEVQICFGTVGCGFFFSFCLCSLSQATPETLCPYQCQKLLFLKVFFGLKPELPLKHLRGERFCSLLKAFWALLSMWSKTLGFGIPW